MHAHMLRPAFPFDVVLNELRECIFCLIPYSQTTENIDGYVNQRCSEERGANPKVSARERLLLRANKQAECVCALRH